MPQASRMSRNCGRCSTSWPSDRLEAVGLFAGRIAHEFNNLLTAILCNVSLTLASSPVGSRPHELLDEAERAILRASALTKQLVTFAKGGSPLKLLCNIRKIAEDSAKAAELGDRIALDFASGPDLRAVEADAGQIDHVVQNLLRNAAEAMPQGGSVQLSTRNAGRWPSGTGTGAVRAR